MKKSTVQILSLIIADIGSLDSLFWKYRQRLADLFLVTCGLYYMIGSYYSLFVLDVGKITNDPSIKDLAHGIFKCISIWNYIVQITFYYSLNITRFIQRTCPPQHPVVMFADYYTFFLEKSFLCVVFPLGLFVCNTFWYVYNTNRDLIYPTLVEDFIPDWYNHTMHTLPEVIVFLHLILVQHKSAPLSISTSMYIQTIFHAFYLSMLLLIRYLDGVWLYKFLGYYAESRTSQIVSALLFCFVSPNVYVWIGYKMNAEVLQGASKVNKKIKLPALAKHNNGNNNKSYLEWKSK